MPITTTPSPDGASSKPMTDEADIGSGEKTPGQLDTEELIRQIPPLKPGADHGSGADAGTDGASRQHDKPGQRQS